MAGLKSQRFKEYFDRKQIMLLDGATGTQLMLMGLKPGECAELWNLDRPEKLRELAKMYFDAGSDAVLTNTSGALKFRLMRHGLEDRVYDLNKTGAENAVSVCPEGKFVIGNIGPTGGYLLTAGGNLEEKDVIEAYGLQVRALVGGGVDAFSLETFANLNEMKCAIKAVKDNSDLPYLCSMTFERKPKGYRTTSGVDISRAVQNLVEEGSFAIGSNCGNGIKEMVEIIREMRDISNRAFDWGMIPEGIRIICKPNAGCPVYDGFYQETPEIFFKYLLKLIEYKPSIIGGCCGTTPEHIKAINLFLNRN